MRLYLDDDTTSGKLIQILRRDGHDVQIPLDVGLSGDSDAVHQTHAIRDDRVLMTCNCDDFNHLHFLIAESGGKHPGIFSSGKTTILAATWPLIISHSQLGSCFRATW